MKEFNGIPVSPGIAVATAFIYDPKAPQLPRYEISAEKTDVEIHRFEKAAAKAKVDLEKIKNSVPNGGGSTESLMVDSQIAMLDDPEWRSRVAEEIRGGKNAEWALNDASDFFIRLLESSGDVYLKERAADISDVTKRVLRQMNTKGSDESISPLADLPEDVILVSRNLLPSDTLAMDKRKVKGFVTETGGRTSHTAILARAFELPAVVGIRSLMKEVKTGDRIIVDGIRGVMIVDPTPEREGLYERYRTEWQLRESRLLTLNHLPAETKDGKRILLMANIELPEEADSAVAHGADGIGLYRSEFLLMNSRVEDNEEEQFRAYRSVLEQMGGKPVTIRTFDMGGDKVVRSVSDAPETESNPILGWRSIRFCLDNPKLFKTQLRALFRAGFQKNLRVMFPMISGTQELLRVYKTVEEVKDELRSAKIPFNADMPIGIMIEVPSAAMTSDILAKYSDFFSIGTNDLIQYTIAVDRGNERIAYLYEAFHPGVLRMLRIIVQNAHKAGISVSMCGEMAGDPLCCALLIGLGLDGFSMSSAVIPEIKRIIRSVTVAEAEILAGQALELETVAQVRQYVEEWMSERFGEK